jgi:hypothetical protein
MKGKDHGLLALKSDLSGSTTKEELQYLSNSLPLKPLNGKTRMYLLLSLLLYDYEGRRSGILYGMP